MSGHKANDPADHDTPHSKVMQHIEQDAAQLKGHGENVKATNGLVMDKAQLQQYLSGLLPLLRQVSQLVCASRSVRTEL